MLAWALANGGAAGMLTSDQMQLYLLAETLLNSHPPMEHSQTISDPSDYRLAPFRDLRHRRSKRTDERFVVEGKLVAQRLLASDLHVESLLVEADKHEWADEWTSHCHVYRVTKPLIRELVGYDFHRGVLAAARRPSSLSIDALICDEASHAETASREPAASRSTMEARTPGRIVLFACGVTDPENFGNIIRSATAFGVTEVAYDNATADPYARRVLRVSMGTAFKQRFLFSPDAGEDLRRLSKEANYRTVATTLADDAKELSAFAHEELSPSSRVILLVGSEAQGLPQAVQRAATDRVTIPMQRHTDSLNASVATGIALYELSRALR